MQHKNLKRLLTSLSAAVVIAGILMTVGPTAFGEKGHLDLRPPHPAVDIREEASAGSGPMSIAPHSPTAATIYVRPGGDDTLCNGTVDVDYTLGIDPNCAVKTIQKGIDLVDSAGTVRIAAGTYTENTRANKPVKLAGAGEALAVVNPAVSLPNPCVGSSLCGSATAASNIILVEASNVKIHDMTLDGDNPGLTSGIVRDGADLDARNGIIENLYAGVFNNLESYNVTVKNIYLCGVYFSSGGNNIFDAGCIGGEYENPSFSTCGGVPGTSPDVVVDGVVNLFDLVLMGSNYELTYSPWSQILPPWAMVSSTW